MRQWLKFFKAEARKAQMRHDSLEWEEWSSKAERAEGLLQRTPQQWAEDIITSSPSHQQFPQRAGQDGVLLVGADQVEVIARGADGVQERVVERV